MRTKSIWAGLETSEHLMFFIQLEHAGVTPEDIRQANEDPRHFRKIGEKICSESPAMTIEESSGAVAAEDLHLL